MIHVLFMFSNGLINMFLLKEKVIGESLENDFHRWVEYVDLTR